MALVLFLLLASGCKCKEVPTSFSYPATARVVQAEPYYSRTLEGVVVTPDKSPLKDVLVEQLDEADNRIDARLSGEDGCFSFPTRRKGRFRIRISRFGYDTHVYTIEVSAGKDKKRLLLMIKASS